MMKPANPRHPDPIDEHVGGRLRARRLFGGMTQAQLARSLGVTYQQVQKYELGSNRISVSKLYRIAEALGVPVSYFFEGLDDPADDCPPRMASRESFLALSSGGALVDAFMAIRPVMRRRIVSLMKEMASASIPDRSDVPPGAGRAAELRA